MLDFFVFFLFHKKMKNIKNLLIAIFSLFVVGCGPIVEVPPAHIGKLTTSSGLQEGIISPSKIRNGDIYRAARKE